MTPHRTEPLTATINVIIDGVPHSAEVLLSPGVRAPKPNTALHVAQREHAFCHWCEHSWNVPLRCAAVGGYAHDYNRDGTCKFYTPTLLTRIVRALRLGRKAVPL